VLDKKKTDNYDYDGCNIYFELKYGVPRFLECYAFFAGVTFPDVSKDRNALIVRFKRQRRNVLSWTTWPWRL